MCSQNSPKMTSADTAIFPHHQQPPFTSKNCHHVIPLISTRCTKNNSQTILKTAQFYPKNSTSFISKTTPLYCQNSIETTMKRHKNGAKNAPSTPPPSSTAAAAVSAAPCRCRHTVASPPPPLLPRRCCRFWFIMGEER